MVFYFTSVHNGQNWTIFMGRDKFENEDLIKYGIEQDVWFHVDDLSSAHVYIRMPDGFSMNMIPQEVIHECACLVKANSIEGCKKSSVKVVYTPWSNLHKRGDMAVGQIGFHNTSLLRFVTVEKNNEIVNRLNKTKKEKPSTVIRESRDEYERRQRALEKKKKKKNADEEKQAKEDAKKREYDESFADLFSDSTNVMSNRDMTVTAEEFESDFL